MLHFSLASRSSAITGPIGLCVEILGLGPSAPCPFSDLLGHPSTLAKGSEIFFRKIHPLFLVSSEEPN